MENLETTRGPGNRDRGVVGRDGGDTSGGFVSPGGWLAFPGAPTPTWPPLSAGAVLPHRLLLVDLKKLRKTHENDDSNFPKTVVKW